MKTPAGGAVAHDKTVFYVPDRASWRRLTSQAHTRQKQPTVEDTRPELNDPDLFPKMKEQNQDEDNHPYTFKYPVGSQPLRTATRLYRYEDAVRVIDLDLRPGTKAHRTAVNSFYFDRTYGIRLYLETKTN